VGATKPPSTLRLESVSGSGASGGLAYGRAARRRGGAFIGIACPDAVDRLGVTSRLARQAFLGVAAIKSSRYE